MIDKALVGNRIAALRKQLNYSQSVFAEKLHVTTQAVSKWETGLALPDIEVLLNISWLSKTSLHALLEGEDFIEPRSGIDRGLLYVSKFLVCPQCREALSLQVPIHQGRLTFACSGGHRYDLVDGVLHFGTREIEGELWSLWLRNYEHYLEEQRHPGNPRYWQGDPNCREVMWQKISALRPRIIIDIACGTGSGIKYMIERINWPTTIIMADLSHRILKWNRIFYSDEWKNPYVDMVYLACDCANLPLADHCLDVVFSNGGFESMQGKMMNGFREAHRVLKPGASAVFNLSAVDDHSSENTQTWLRLYMNLEKSYHPAKDRTRDINQWSLALQDVGFRRSEVTKIYDELPAPTEDVFPFENQILRWMANYVVLSQK